MIWKHLKGEREIGWVWEGYWIETVSLDATLLLLSGVSDLANMIFNYLLLNDFPPKQKKCKKKVMDSRFSAASRNMRYFRALEDNEMLEKLQSKPWRRNAQIHIMSSLGYFSNYERGQPYLNIETGEKWRVNLAKHFSLLPLGLLFLPLQQI